MKKLTKGIVQEIINHNEYVISTEKFGDVICTLSKKAKTYLEYDILQGETIQIEISPLSSNKGRIEPRGWDRTLLPPNKSIL